MKKPSQKNNLAGLMLSLSFTACGHESKQKPEDSVAAGDENSDKNSSQKNDVSPSKGHEFTQTNDEAYAVAGIGQCRDNEIVIPSSY